MEQVVKRRGAEERKDVRSVYEGSQARVHLQSACVAQRAQSRAHLERESISPTPPWPLEMTMVYSPGLHGAHRPTLTIAPPHKPTQPRAQSMDLPRFTAAVSK